jgi:uncharacterized membrane protein YeaQ/YmgE (transglycosylase-associated protein family)
MSIGTLIVLGLIVGFVANKFVMRRGAGLFRDFGLAASGALLAGGLLHVLSMPTESEVSVFGVVATLAGASAALVLFHTLNPHVPAG